jgi:hypothetical protein
MTEKGCSSKEYEGRKIKEGERCSNRPKRTRIQRRRRAGIHGYSQGKRCDSFTPVINAFLENCKLDPSLSLYSSSRLMSKNISLTPTTVGVCCWWREIHASLWTKRNVCPLSSILRMEITIRVNREGETLASRFSTQVLNES